MFRPDGICQCRSITVHTVTGTEIAIDCPVRLIHGQQDRDVPWEYSLRLARQLRSADVQVTLVKDGDHRLSRIEDVVRMLGQIEWLLDSLKAR